MGYSANYGAFYGTVSTLALSWLRKDTRMGPKKIFHGLIAGGHNNTSAGAAIGSLGLIIGGVILAGLGLKFSAVLVEFAGVQLFLTVVLVTIISIVIGMGSSTTGSYIILAVVAAPALIHLGVDQVAAHLVVFYAACLSNVTPPVCVSAFAGAAIAGADPMKTGFAALKFGATLVLIPFSFVYMPELLLIGEPAEIAYAALRYLTGYAVLAMGIQKTEFLTGEISQSRYRNGGASASSPPRSACCSRCCLISRSPASRWPPSHGRRASGPSSRRAARCKAEPLHGSRPGRRGDRSGPGPNGIGHPCVHGGPIRRQRESPGSRPEKWRESNRTTRDEPSIGSMMKSLHRATRTEIYHAGLVLLQNRRRNESRNAGHQCEAIEMGQNG
jgi:hypothetical protein